MTREEAIKLIEHISIAFVPTDQYGDYDDPQPYEEALDMAIEALSDRPTGEWVDKDGEIVCSLCGNSVSFSWVENSWVLGRFCQSCGAKMGSKEVE